MANESQAPFDTAEQPLYETVGFSLVYVWDVATLEWVKMTQPGGGGGGAVTIADGADVAEGATTDAAVTTDAAGTVSGKLRGLVKWAYERMPAALGQTTMAASLPVTMASDQSTINVGVVGGSVGILGTPPVNVTNWGSVATTQGQKAMGASVPVVIASDQASIPVAATQGTNPWTVAGNLTHNNAAPGAANVGVLPAVASAAAPTYTEGDQVLLSTDLAGSVRISGTIAATSAATATENAPSYTEGVAEAFSQDLSGNLRVIDSNVSQELLALGELVYLAKAQIRLMESMRLMLQSVTSESAHPEEITSVFLTN